jgi:hypothetical protein
MEIRSEGCSAYSASQYAIEMDDFETLQQARIDATVGGGWQEVEVADTEIGREDGEEWEITEELSRATNIVMGTLETLRQLYCAWRTCGRSTPIQASELEDYEMVSTVAQNALNQSIAFGPGYYERFPDGEPVYPEQPA